MPTSQPVRARIVQLCCPSTQKTIDNFMITPSQSHKDIRLHMRRALREEDEVFPCDINGEELWDINDPVSSLAHLETGEKVLVALSKNERIRPETELEVVLHLEGEGLQKTLRKLSRADRRAYFRTLRRQDAGPRRNILRLNLPYSEVTAAIFAFEIASDQKLRTAYSISSSRRIISENWGVKTIFTGTRECLALLAILSSATCGQPIVIEDALIDAKIMRTSGANADVSKGLQPSNVRKVIEDVYKMADAVNLVWPDNVDNNAIAGNKRRQEMQGKGKEKEKEAEEGNALAKELGKDAATVAKPATKAERALNKLSSELGRVKVPDNVVVEEDEEDSL